MHIKTLGVDLAKNIFQVHGVDAQRQVVLRKCLSRSDLGLLDNLIQNSCAYIAEMWD